MEDSARIDASLPAPNRRLGFADTCVVRRVLLIDDDLELVELLSQSLTREGFDLTLAHTGEEGLTLARPSDVDLVLLDVNLPDISGFEVLRRLRRESDLPVIMLTARGDEVDRIVGLEIGADDYLPKPFSFRELIARIGAILRRVRPAPAPKTPTEPARRVLHHGAVRLDPLSRTVWRSGKIVLLTTSEFELLRSLMESAGEPVRREDLSHSVLDREYSPYDRSIDNLVSALRRKLGAMPDGRERIKSIRNVGYLYADIDTA